MLMLALGVQPTWRLSLIPGWAGFAAPKPELGVEHIEGPDGAPLFLCPSLPLHLIVDPLASTSGLIRLPASLGCAVIPSVFAYPLKYGIRRGVLHPARRIVSHRNTCARNRRIRPCR